MRWVISLTRVEYLSALGKLGDSWSSGGRGVPVDVDPWQAVNGCIRVSALYIH